MTELNPHSAWVIGLIVLALVLFTVDRIRLQATALFTLVLLLVSFVLFPFHYPDGTSLEIRALFSVFSNQALIAVCALMILGKGVEVTQALQPLVSIVSRRWPESPRTTMLGILLGAAFFSAFLNNTPIVVIMLPVLLSIAQKNRVGASKLLMPLGLVTIVGGMSTTIGTSTNLLVVDLAEEIAAYHVGIFDLLPYFAIAGCVGVFYLWLIAPALIPERTAPGATAQDAREPRQFMATMVIEQDNQLAGKTIADMLGATKHSISVDRVQHGKSTYRLPLPSVELHEGDHLYVQGSITALKEAEIVLGTTLHTLQSDQPDDPELEPIIQEILVTERSELDGVSLRRSGLLENYGVLGIALHRPEHHQTRSKRPLNRIRLEAGDILLCQGSRSQLEQMLAETRLLALTDETEVHFNQRSTTSLIIIAGVVLLAALEILPISVSALVGVGLMRATKCIAWRHIGQALSTQVILVIVVSLALGQALMATGGDRYIASLLATGLAGFPPEYTIPGLMLGTALLTNVVSNNAAAVIGTPMVSSWRSSWVSRLRQWCWRCCLEQISASRHPSAIRPTCLCSVRVATSLAISCGSVCRLH